MSHDVMIELLADMIYVSVLLMLPPLGVALVVGLTIGLLQAITSIQEQTLSFVPKVLAIAAIFVFGGPWMGRLIVQYTTELFANLHKYGAL